MSNEERNKWKEAFSSLSAANSASEWARTTVREYVISLRERGIDGIVQSPVAESRVLDLFRLVQASDPSIVDVSPSSIQTVPPLANSTCWINRKNPPDKRRMRKIGMGVAEVKNDRRQVPREFVHFGKASRAHGDVEGRKVSRLAQMERKNKELAALRGEIELQPHPALTRTPAVVRRMRAGGIALRDMSRASRGRRTEDANENERRVQQLLSAGRKRMQSTATPPKEHFFHVGTTRDSIEKAEKTESLSTCGELWHHCPVKVVLPEDTPQAVPSYKERARRMPGPNEVGFWMIYPTADVSADSSARLRSRWSAIGRAIDRGDLPVHAKAIFPLEDDSDSGRASISPSARRSVDDEDSGIVGTISVFCTVENALRVRHILGSIPELGLGGREVPLAFFVEKVGNRGGTVYMA